jgi:hypothetical protein
MVVEAAPIDVFAPLVKIRFITNKRDGARQPHLNDGGYGQNQKKPVAVAQAIRLHKRIVR